MFDSLICKTIQFNGMKICHLFIIFKIHGSVYHHFYNNSPKVLDYEQLKEFMFLDMYLSFYSFFTWYYRYVLASWCFSLLS